jgi:hypothetical protein
MHTTERTQPRGIEGLRADRDAIHAGRGVFSEAPALDGAGIRLERDFRSRGDGQFVTQCLQHPTDRGRRKQARRTTAEKDTRHRPTAQKLRVALDLCTQINTQCIDVGLLRQWSAQGVRVEVTVRTFAHAPWEVQVDAERDRHAAARGSRCSRSRSA